MPLDTVREIRSTRVLTNGHGVRTIVRTQDVTFLMSGRTKTHTGAGQEFPAHDGTGVTAPGTSGIQDRATGHAARRGGGRFFGIDWWCGDTDSAPRRWICWWLDSGTVTSPGMDGGLAPQTPIAGCRKRWPRLPSGKRPGSHSVATEMPGVPFRGSRVFCMSVGDASLNSGECGCSPGFRPTIDGSTRDRPLRRDTRQRAYRRR